MVNDDVLLSPALQNKESHQRSLGACALLFGSGALVEKDLFVQNSLLAKMDQSSKTATFGKILLEALESEDLVLAEGCLDFGAGVRSIDDDGHFALPSAAVIPGGEKFLETILSRTANPQDVFLLESALGHAQQKQLEKSAEVIKRHLSRLQGT